MEKIKLPNVTLICLTGKNFEGHKNAVDYSCRGIEFGGVKIIWDEKIKNVDDWSRKVVYELWRYVDTEFALFIHPDGFVVNPESWNPDWLKYDYIGGVWPMPTDDYSYRDPNGTIQRVGNSISLRSKKLMTMPSLLGLDWKPYFGYYNEDGFLSCHNRLILEEAGCKWAPIDVAVNFCREFEIEENKHVDKPFCFHMVDSWNGRNEEYLKLIKNP